jgi:hypothetical protein
MEPMTLSFDVLIAYLNRAIAGMEDPRKTSNATKYSLKDAVLAAFSVFFMQRESFLDYQRYQESYHSRSNAQSLFGVILTRAGFCEHRILAKALLGVTAMFTINRSG